MTELGYGVQRIEAALVRGGDMEKVRDHTFAQLTAMVADVRGSMMLRFHKANPQFPGRSGVGVTHPRAPALSGVNGGTGGVV